ncbi:hypothetical protein Pfo_010361 [Paulownia fortunei]|nr:hypothetical protein Pfo_010361 [Paulownia fortunei]
MNSVDQQSIEDGSSQYGSESHIWNLEDADYGFRKPRRYSPKKREVKIEGKKMVANGIDASQGVFDDNADDWCPAVNRSTHRRYLRRKARHEMNEASSQLGDQEGTSSDVENENLDDAQCPELLVDESYEERTNGKLEGGNTSNKNGDEDISTSLNKMKLEEESIMPFHDIDELKSWTLRSLSESSVACVTSDFAMQNVLLQMGLRLLAPGGMQIHELHRWVLKCHACFMVTTETSRIFCPKCGNGGTLLKVAVTVNENGIVLAGRRPCISLRGTKELSYVHWFSQYIFTLYLPRGGRDAVTKNPILREDQLPQKFLYPKIKKKNKQEEDFFVPDDIFRHHTDKKAPHQPPVRKALAVFSGKRNPNDNHFARAKC